MAGNGEPKGFPTALAGAIALVVAGLAAIGVTGDPLLRAVRNHPILISICLGIAVLGAAVFVFAQLAPADAGWKQGFVYGGVIGVGVAIIGSIVLGALTVDDLERPSVTLQAAPVAAAPSGASAGWGSGTIELTITARASSLTSDNELMVQIIGLVPDPQTMASIPPPPDRPPPAAPSEAIPWAVVNICESNHTYQPGAYIDPKVAKVLMWNRAGSKADGSIDMTWKIQIPAGRYEYACAWAQLGNAHNPNEADKNSAAYIRLN
jgi:hypothetical protein